MCSALASYMFLTINHQQFAYETGISICKCRTTPYNHKVFRCCSFRMALFPHTASICCCFFLFLCGKFSHEANFYALSFCDTVNENTITATVHVASTSDNETSYTDDVFQAFSKLSV